jgi:hypothetical protein
VCQTPKHQNSKTNFFDTFVSAVKKIFNKEEEEEEEQASPNAAPTDEKLQMNLHFIPSNQRPNYTFESEARVPTSPKNGLSIKLSDFPLDKSTAADSNPSPCKSVHFKVIQQDLPMLAHAATLEGASDEDVLVIDRMTSNISPFQIEANDSSFSPKKLSFGYELKRTRSSVQKLHHRTTSSVPDIDFGQTEEKSDSGSRKDSEEYTVTTPRSNNYHPNTVELKPGNTPRGKTTANFDGFGNLKNQYEYFNPFKSANMNNDPNRVSYSTSNSESPGYGNLMELLASSHDQN